MNDQEKKDLAQAYQLMMESVAWKHFNENVLNQIEFSTIRAEDEIPIAEINLAQVGECRGRRGAIKKIHSDLNYILEGLK